SNKYCDQGSNTHQRSTTKPRPSSVPQKSNARDQWDLRNLPSSSIVVSRIDRIHFISHLFFRNALAKSAIKDRKFALTSRLGRIIHPASMPIEKTRTQSRKLRRQIQRIEIRRPGCRLVRLAHVDFELKLETVGVDPDRVRLVRELHLLD